MESFGQIVSRAFPVPAWQERLKAMKVLSRWEEIVGEGLARATRPRGFSRGTLILEVEDSLWMQRLRFEEKRLLARLNQAAGERLFKGLRLVLSRGGIPRPRSSSRKLPQPSPELLSRVEKEVAVIEDPELREAFKRLRLTLLLKARRGLRPRGYRAHPGPDR
ncbi:MAG: DUF721 domain-containing protein [Thermodesulfobacteria bacterium]|nr:DUF721 domain-containing protein [Thermodesulfobacteriota bacterium]